MQVMKRTRRQPPALPPTSSCNNCLGYGKVTEIRLSGVPWEEWKELSWEGQEKTPFYEKITVPCSFCGG